MDGSGSGNVLPSSTNSRSAFSTLIMVRLPLLFEIQELVAQELRMKKLQLMPAASFRSPARSDWSSKEVTSRLSWRPALVFCSSLLSSPACLLSWPYFVHRSPSPQRRFRHSLDQSWSAGHYGNQHSS